MKLLFLLAPLAVALQSAPKLQTVDCDKGQTIAFALGKADAGDTVRVSGKCSELVTITMDRIVLVGVSGATIQGGAFAQPKAFSGLITVDGAHGVRISGFTVQRSRAEGILGIRGAAFAVESTVVQDNAGEGLMVGGGSALELTNSTIRRNHVGLDVFNGSSAVLLGEISITDNKGDVGIYVGGTSTLEIRGAKVHVSDSPVGVVVDSNAHLGFFTFPGDAARGGSLTVSRNTVAGITIINSTLEVFSDNATITAANNPVGIDMPAGGAIASPFGIEKGIRFLIHNNGVGLNLGQGSNVVIVGGLDIRNNTTAGIIADNSSFTLVGAPPNPSTTTGNGVDLDLRFGTRATLADVSFNTKKCEPTVLARGIAGCP